MTEVIFNDRQASTDTDKHPVTSRIVLGCEVAIFWLGVLLFIVETILAIPFLVVIWAMLRLQDRSDSPDDN